MYCPKCGAQQADGVAVCSNCKAILNPNVTKPVENSNNMSILWGVLGFLVPLLGLILFLVWREEKPKDAKAAGIGGLIGFVGNIILSIIYFILSVLLYVI